MTAHSVPRIAGHRAVATTVMAASAILLFTVLSAGTALALHGADHSHTTTLWTDFFSNPHGWADHPSYWRTIQFARVAGIPQAACGRGRDGIWCALRALNAAGTYFTNAFQPPSLWTTDFSNAHGWMDQPYYWQTIRFPDVNGDGLADVCGRSSLGIQCALSTGTAFGPAALWTTSFSNAGIWDSAEHYWQTIDFPDLNGDRKADVCGRSGGGIVCGLSTGSGFGIVTLWTFDFSDTGGWQNHEAYWRTIRFPDVNGDGKADACGRGAAGVTCALSTGTSFGNSQMLAPEFSDAGGWKSHPSYWQTIQFPDLNLDGKADVCGRGVMGIHCALSTGSSFGPASLLPGSSVFGDSYGWNSDPSLYRTVRILNADIGGGGVRYGLDICGRGFFGIVCAYWNGTAFAPLDVLSSAFSTTKGWTVPSHWGTIDFVVYPGVLQIATAVCGRGWGGIWCADLTDF